jgi:hypothetical protein
MTGRRSDRFNQDRRGLHAMEEKMTEVRSVRIICDPVLRDGVLKQISDFGVTGFTWWEAHGKGHRETVPDVETMAGWNRSFGGEKRTYIEVWCPPQIAEKIVVFCQGSQFRGIGMIVGLGPLLVHEDESVKFAVK